MLVLAAVLISVLITGVIVVFGLQLFGGTSVSEARKEAETIRREAKIEAREDAVRVRAEVEREVAEHRGGSRRSRSVCSPARTRWSSARRSSHAASRASRIARCTSRNCRTTSKEAKQRELTELEHVAGMTVNEAEGAPPRAIRGASPPRPRTPGAPARRRGSVRGEATRQEPRCRRAPASCREPRSGDDVVADRAPVRRHEGADHRPRGTEHSHPRAPDRGGRDRRRHAPGGRALSSFDPIRPSEIAKITSTPVRCSRVRMFGKTQPMIRPLHVVGRELDQRRRRLRCVARGNSLESVGNESLARRFGLGLSLFVELAHPACEVVAD